MILPSGITNHDQAKDARMEELIVDWGTLNGGASSSAFGISADGKMVVGLAYDGTANNVIRAFRWTRETGMLALNQLKGADNATAHTAISEAQAMSVDGKLTIGTLAQYRTF